MSKFYDLLSAMCGKIKKPDWNQNDPTAADYVKNRPFSAERKTILERQTVTGFAINNGLYAATLPNALEITDGKTIVYWDGNEYECIAQYGYVGNQMLTGGMDTHEPFGIMVQDGTTIIASITSNATSHEIGVDSKIIHKLDAEYLPEFATAVNLNLFIRKHFDSDFSNTSNVSTVDYNEALWELINNTVKSALVTIDTNDGRIYCYIEQLENGSFYGQGNTPVFLRNTNTDVTTIGVKTIDFYFEQEEETTITFRYTFDMATVKAE